MDSRHKTTLSKAFDINSDPLRYGSFAEIGAGQEVARQFFQAGKASQTIALTISAYDMTYSDIIYGKEKSGRYVCESRVHKMLDREYAKLIDRLAPIRGQNTCFFAFADTVATSSEGSKKSSHGWMGVKFQTQVGSDPSEIILHIRLLDKHRLQQQETLSIMGVNLLYASFYKLKSSDEFVDALFDQIKHGSIGVDAIHFSGDAFKKFNEIQLNLMLIEKGWSNAIYINEDGRVQNPSDALWGKNILIQRAFYSPVTNTHLDIADRGSRHFAKEFSLRTNDITTLFEFTLNNRLKDLQITVDEAMNKVAMITSLKKPILVSNFALFYQLKEYIRQMTDKPLAMVIGASHLDKLLDEKFYFDLPGGLLEGMGKLLDSQTRLYTYPHKTHQVCLMTKNFNPPENNKHIFQHLIDHKFIQDIAGCDEISEFIHSEDVLRLYRNKNPQWKKMVPESIQAVFKDIHKAQTKKS